MTTTTAQYDPSQTLSMPESLALGLLGAGAFIGVGLLAKNPQARKVLGRFLTSPELREIGEGVVALVRRVLIESGQQFLTSLSAE